VSNIDLAATAVTTDKIVDGTITNDDINANAAIATTKIAGEAVVKTTVHTGDVNGVWNVLAITPGAVTTTKILDGTITNDDIGANAAIAVTKIVGEAVVKTTIHTGEVAGVWNSLTINPSAVTSTKILDGTITNDDIGANASIASTKILGEALVKTTVLTGEVAGAWNALTIQPSAGLTTNQTMPQLGVTNIFCFTNGLLKVVLYP
jgi:predicted secreted protein